MHTRRSVLQLAGASLTMLATRGLARAEPAAQLIADAKAEGQVVWYTGLIIKQLVRPLTRNFQDKYGIEVKYTSFVSLLLNIMLMRLVHKEMSFPFLFHYKNKPQDVYPFFH